MERYIGNTTKNLSFSSACVPVSQIWKQKTDLARAAAGSNYCKRLIQRMLPKNSPTAMAKLLQCVVCRYEKRQD